MVRDTKESKEISIWISYEDTLENQSKFLNWVEILSKNKGVVPFYSRKTFFRLLSKATLTVGRGQKVYYRTKNGVLLPMGNLHYFAQRLSYQTVTNTKWKFKGKEYIIPINELWNLLQDHLLRIYPYAQAEAIKMSAERFRVQAQPGSVDYYPTTRSFRE